MSKVRIYNYTDKDLPEDIRKAFEVLSSDNKVSKRLSLHDIFKSKGLQCFCSECYEKKVYNKSIT
mgnify:CR=1 FL=1